MNSRIELADQPPTPGRSGQGAAEAAVIKKPSSGAAGTRRLLARYGAALVCVRYREDAARNRRYTTVELLVDERPGKSALVPVRIGYLETSLRQQVKAAGGKWDAGRKLWTRPRTAVWRLGLKDRVVRGDG
jgi:hypothetical protein